MLQEIDALDDLLFLHVLLVVGFVHCKDRFFIKAFFMVGGIEEAIEKNEQIVKKN